MAFIKPFSIKTIAEHVLRFLARSLPKTPANTSKRDFILKMMHLIPLKP